MSTLKVDRDSSEAFAALKQYLIDNFGAKEASGGKEIIKRCHFCGDSSDSHSRHLYIGQTNDGSIVYNCFKCNAGGKVDGKFLRDMGCYEPGLIELCQEQNRNAYNSSHTNSGKVRRPRKFRNLDHLQIYSKPGPYTDKKISYLENRLGYKISMRDLINFKIILNLKEFLEFNGINSYSRHPDLVNQLDKFFMGFLSMDNRYVIMRRLVPEGKVSKYIDSRYVNYDIFGGYSNYERNGIKYYTIPNIVDVSKPLEIHIAEGAFDIISIYSNVAPYGTNGVFAAVCGKSYDSLVKYFIMNYGFTGFDLHLYPDNDVKPYELNKIKEIITPYGINLITHRNTYPGEKDYGVNRDHIKDTII